MYWVKSRPTFPPPAKWTREEDEELLVLYEKYYGRWKDVPYKLSHTPYECEVRRFELSQQHLSKGRPQSVSIDASQFKEDKDQLGPVAVANTPALEATAGIDAAMPISLRNAWESMFNIPLDDLANDTAIIKLGECEEKVRELHKETDQLVKQKDLAIKETHLRRAELGKVRDHVKCLEAAVVRAEEKQRNAEIEVEAKVMEQRDAERRLDKQLLLAYIYGLRAEFQRANTQTETKEDFLKRHFSDTGDAQLLSKHVESAVENLDKPSKRLKISSNFVEGNYLHSSGGSQGSIHPTSD